jgi:hypothetical protein
LIEKILSPVVQEFIRKNAHVDVNALLLKQQDIDGVPSGIIANQIEGRKKAHDKIPLYYNTTSIVYPPVLNLEQSSSEITAQFKNQILDEYLPDKSSVVDLTGGFGIDSFFFHKVFKKVTTVEPDPTLLEICAHNHRVLGARNIQYENLRAEIFIKETHEDFSLVFIDPSRRNKSLKRVYTFSECEPDITKLHSQVFSLARFLLIKASPLLDIHQGIKDLAYVKCVFVVAVENECKEILFLSERNFKEQPIISAVNLTGNGFSRFDFTTLNEENTSVDYSDPQDYLYEPNAAIMKAGAFKLIAKEYGIHKLHPNTHLYTSTNILNGFPGRIFKIVAFVKPRPSSVQPYFQNNKANVSVRNYPMTVLELRQATGLKDGGENYLIGCSGLGKKFLVVAHRLIT